MKSGKLELVVSIAEIVSALAVTASLLYVGYEVRRSETMSSREADNALYERVSAATRIVVETPDVAELLVKVSEDPESLAPAERLRYVSLQHDFFDSWEMAWAYRVDGILEEAAWKEWDTWFLGEAARMPEFAWTENRRNYTGPDFLAHVETSLGY